MSGFTNEALERKLLDLNNSQQSIQTLSLWLIHHRKHNKQIVQTWFKELKKTKAPRRLTFMYLANDVIQNSRKKGPEFTKEFGCALKAAFEVVSRDADQKTLQSLDRIIQIWSERNIYEATALSEYKKALHSGPNGKFASNHKSSSNVDLHSNDKKRRDHAHTHSHHHSSKSGDEPNTSKKTKSSNNSINVMNLLSQTNAELPVKGEDVDPNDLIKSLKALEQTASCDAAVRERISKLPPELSDMSLLAKIENKEQMNRLSNQVEDAHRLLSDYHQRLVQELEERKQVSIRLAAYHRLQKLQMQEAEKHLSEYQQRLEKVTQVKDGLRSHLQNLPDLTLLPSVTGGLAPLPTPNDLFTASKLVNPRQQRNDDTDSSNSSPIRAVSSPIMLSPNPPAYEPIGVDNKHDDNNIEIEAEYVPSAVKFNEAGGIATSYSSAFVP